ncbi:MULTISPECIES: molybdopterin-dependent oxidoreductase [unclassified Microbacterium]|uniref:molybdopterin-dependent oxidoreductase n=1 Tax=unclassified Microbacterium TaxID=2609290 RepID=UPI00214C294D|nr:MULTISPECIES: molybdopterin-dependent oxidoreductase [unclassified Microbacterium]MCR2810330.1 molybdopterin-dependent oxidoreductase [Microbacterium sp. zg.B185]WIM18389.1 molybdopterin-dependent oxidoreductase [Microbacterium sp. zg-B185]
MAQSSVRTRVGVFAWAALAGAVSSGVFLAAAELVALLAAPESSPILAVGSFVIDIVPQPLKELAIATFGAHDKIALLVGLALAVLVGSVVAGVLQFAVPPAGVAVLAVAGGLSVAATITRAGATALAALPPIAGTVAGCLVLWLLIRLLRPATPAVVASDRGEDARDSVQAVPAEHPTVHEKGAAARVDRRMFFRVSAVVASSAVLVGVGARALINAGSSSIAAVRTALRLPAPRTTVTVPAGAEFDIPGLSPLFTPNRDFYRVDTALTVPSVDPAEWRLVIDGMVQQRVELTFSDLLELGLDEYPITLTCVSNEVGGDLVGNAIWLGVPVRDVLRMARPSSGADMVLSRSIDGFTASTPLESLTDEGLDAILAVGMNGEPLPLEHGFPVRMVVPGLYGYVSATKWLSALTVTRFDADEAYWTPRGYSAQAPIKFSARIDTPRSGTRVPAGRAAIAGVAWAQTVGIERVEVSIDDGTWQPAAVSAPISDDTWVQWYLDWDATPGAHFVAVRAVNRHGEVQNEQRAPIAPDGSSGWQRTLIQVG